MSIKAKEIAKMLGISETAVSMALNNKPGVSEETRNNVIRLAEQHGFDFKKLSHKGEKKSSIFYINYRRHSAILNCTSVFAELADGVAQACRQNNYLLKTVQIYPGDDDLEAILGDIRVSNCVGLILLGTEMTSDVCSQFLKLRIPVVLLDTYLEDVNCSSIQINNVRGAKEAVDYLISRTRQQPGHLRSSYVIPNFIERRIGFERAVREYGMSVNKCVTHELSPSIVDAHADMLEIIDRGDELARCYFADNDLIAIGAINAFKERGYRVPEDIAVIGFDNISESTLVSPTLTTVDVPRVFIGQTAVNQLIYQLDFPLFHRSKIEVSTSIIKRASI